MRSLVSAFLRAAAALLAPAAPALACGADSDCPVAAGDYRIRIPAKGAAARPGAIVWLHEHRGSPEQALAHGDLTRAADRLGVALIAPRGPGGRWNLPGAFGGEGRDEVAFINATVDDAVARFGLDRSHVLVSGFSLGGSMAWYVACKEGRRYMGYAPVAGAFWEPYPEACAAPAPFLRHVHGRADMVVPLAGRQLSRARQGDVRRSFELLRRSWRCEAIELAPDPRFDFSCSHWSCGGSAQSFCLHSGGHFVDPRWIEEAFREAAAAAGR
jgi:polyhydroxybutyrate depolymerase